MENQSRKESGPPEYGQLNLLADSVSANTTGSAGSRKSVDDSTRNELLAFVLALASVQGVGFKSIQLLFDNGYLHDFEKTGASELLQQLALILRHNVANSIVENRGRLITDGRHAADELAKQGILFIPLGHKDYPPSLLRLSSPPRWIFAKGHLNALLTNNSIAVVGTRKASREGEKLARHCARALVQHNLVVLSGLAKGIDEQAHWGAVDYFGQSIAVLGHGLAPSHLSENQNLVLRILEMDGLIVTEYLPEDPPSRQRFLRRNELQAALSRLVIPVECPSLESGTGATIRRALNLATPLAGIIPQEASDASLATTRDNLTRLGIPVFTVLSKDRVSADFWEYLMDKLALGVWNLDPQPRQDRFFRLVERQFLEAERRLTLDSTAVDRFAESIKQKLTTEGL